MDEGKLEQLKEMYDELQHSVPSDWDVPTFDKIEAIAELEELLSDMEDDTRGD